MKVINKLARSFIADNEIARADALMRFLSRVSIKLGVGKHVYVVGGAVRNFILKKPIKDIDVVIDSIALGRGRDSDWFAKQVMKNIPAKTTLTTNQYDVAIITVKSDWFLDDVNLKGEVIEIANARKESYGGGGGKGYKPSDIEPATIEVDTIRREFTFNTLLWRLMDLTKGPEKAEIIDLTGCGLRDLNNREMRCPKDPDVVFSDDPTRILRAIKFVAKYGFTIPPDLFKSIQKNAHLMKRAPWEAIAKLLVKNVLEEPTARKSLKLMKKLGILDVLAEMVQEQKPFASYLSKQLRNKEVQILLDLMDLGLKVKSPISFLDKKQQLRLRQLTVPMPTEDATEFLELLIKPPINSKGLIDEFNLQGRDRGSVVSIARSLMLERPELAHNPKRLLNEVRGVLKATLGKRAMVSALKLFKNG